ncbi:MAG TPA: bifunctional D-glycero-beta-D-manno-heptose-7-phosphate kinase/D-glycero-beta-D-manno-heptose 1-phosphate adenylyltransferase HldE [Gammaproteobacteria bacterium]
MALSIPDFADVRVLVAGDVMLDEYWFGDTGRISPEAPVPVVKARSLEHRAGGAANVALNISALGGQARLVAVTGQDSRAERLADLLTSAGVNCEFVADDHAPTIHKLRVLSRNQQLIRLDSEGLFSGHEQAITELFRASLDDVDAVVLSDYGKGTLASIEPLISAATDRGVPVLVDPKGLDFSRYRGATVLTPNQTEFEAVVDTGDDEAAFKTAGEALRDDLDLGALLVTRGHRGMTLFAGGEEPLDLAAQAREVFDVTGAGDTVIGLMAAGLGSGLELDNAAALANLGAGLVVGKIGVASVSPSELRLALHRRGEGGRGLVTQDEAATLIEEARQRRERIVMTNGCFDILHAGHVTYLEEAKALGDRLVVAVNDDASVARLKGESRPITPLEDRMAVLAGLAAVDWVVPFSTDTPAALIARLKPDVLVKGGDYEVSEIAGGKDVIANGGEVRILSLKEGRSTTSLIETIKNS